VSDGLNDVLVERVDALGSTPWSSQCFRYTSARRDALSGEGARRHGGRWNPKDLFPAIYLADSEVACMNEVDRAAETNGLAAEKMLTVPYRLHTIEVNDLPVLDLRSADNQERVGLEVEDLFGRDWSACQAVGHAAWFLEMAGVVAPAAGGIGLVITAFEHRTRPGQVVVRNSRDLTPELYRILRGLGARSSGA
jgi:RES domain-containing protein